MDPGESLRTIIADWASIVGSVGLVIAIVQLLRTKRAVTVATEAIGRTEQALALNQVLVLLPQLTRLEGDLDAAVLTNTRDAVVRYLVEWRRVAMELHGLTRHQSYAIDEELAQLRGSAVAAAATKLQLINHADQSLTHATLAVRREIGTACEYANALSGRLRAYSGGTE